MMTIKVGNVVIQKSNDYGPNGTDPIYWALVINGQFLCNLAPNDARELLIALQAWQKIVTP